MTQYTELDVTETEVGWCPTIPEKGVGWYPTIPEKGVGWYPTIPEKGVGWSPNAPLPGLDPASMYILSGPLQYYDPVSQQLRSMLIATPISPGVTVVAVPSVPPQHYPAHQATPPKPLFINEKVLQSPTRQEDLNPGPQGLHRSPTVYSKSGPSQKKAVYLSPGGVGDAGAGAGPGAGAGWSPPSNHEGQLVIGDRAGPSEPVRAVGSAGVANGEGSASVVNGVGTTGMVNGVRSTVMVNGEGSAVMANGVGSMGMVNGSGSAGKVNGVCSAGRVNGVGSTGMVAEVHDSILPGAPYSSQGSNFPPQACLTVGGGGMLNGGPRMQIPVRNLGGQCPLHRPHSGTPYMMYWDPYHPTGVSIPLRQPNPPVYFNLPNKEVTVQPDGHASWCPSSSNHAENSTAAACLSLNLNNNPNDYIQLAPQTLNQTVVNVNNVNYAPYHPSGQGSYLHTSLERPGYLVGGPEVDLNGACWSHQTGPGGWAPHVQNKNCVNSAYSRPNYVPPAVVHTPQNAVTAEARARGPNGSTLQNNV